MKDADTLDFAGFVDAYEELVGRSRAGKLVVEDFAGGTVTITNPGTLGTTQSMPRLMRGQGAIVGIGALDYPVEFQTSPPETLRALGIGKIVTLTSTYDHRIIQGAESGLFLKRVHELLVGEHDFYDEVFSSLGVAGEPLRWPKGQSDGRTRRRRAEEGADGPVAHQHVPGARPPHRAARPARDRTAPDARRPRPRAVRARAGRSRPRLPHLRPAGGRDPLPGGDPRDPARRLLRTRSAWSTCTSRVPRRSSGSSTTSRGFPRR